MIAVSELRKTYGKGKPALDGLDLQVREGSVCGLLGPNGAGKTTTVRILSTLTRPDGGQAAVAGFDISKQPHEVRQRIGLVGQYAAVDELLPGRDNLIMFARLNHLPWPQARTRAGELLERFGLADTGRKPVSAYSGGMRRRLDLAAGLLVAPPVLFVDEPTSGLDPRGRREVWSAVRELVAGGTTILLTTQYLEEADLLADHICVLNEGKAVAAGTPKELKATIGGDWIDITLADDSQVAVTKSILEPLASGPVRVEENMLSVPVAARTKTLVEIANVLAAQGIEPLDINLRQPTLDEVFLHLTEVRGE